MTFFFLIKNGFFLFFVLMKARLCFSPTLSYLSNNNNSLTLCYKYLYIIYLAETTTYGQRKRAGNTMEVTRSRTNIGRILIVSTGSVVSIILILIIVRVTYTYHRLSPTFNPWKHMGRWFHCWLVLFKMFLLEYDTSMLFIWHSWYFNVIF